MPKGDKSLVLFSNPINEELLKDIMNSIPDLNKYTRNQLNFVKAYMSGKRLRECYVEAYPETAAKITNKSTLSSRGSMILKNENIKELINIIVEKERELNINSAINSCIISVEDRKLFLSNVIRGLVCNKVLNKNGEIVELDANIEVKLKSLDLLNKMESLYDIKNESENKDIIINVISEGSKQVRDIEDPNKNPTSIDLTIEGVEDDKDNLSDEELSDN